MAKKVDRNQPGIVRDLRRMGCGVQSLAVIGKGAPDLLVGWKGHSWAFEIKDPLQPPSKRRLTPDEKLWHELWKANGGQVDVIHTTEDALKIMLGGSGLS